MALTEDSKVIKLSRHILATKGNVSTGFFTDNDLPFEHFLRMAQINSEILVKRAQALLVKNDLPLIVSQ